MRPHRRVRAWLALVALLLTGITACAADRTQVRDEPPPILESRTGVPVLMDLPVIGVLFRKTTVVR